MTLIQRLLPDALQIRYSKWIDRRLPVVNSIELNQKKIFIFPSRAGLGFFILLLLIVILAINYQNNLVFAVCFWLFGMMLVTIFHTFANLAGLKLSVGPVKSVFAGEQAAFPLRIESPGRGRQTLEFVWEGQCHQLFSLPADGELSVELPFVVPKRGRFTPPRLLVKTYYPLGLLRAWTWLALDWRCIVYPRPEFVGAPPPAAGVGDEQIQHNFTSGDDFSGFHTYQPGESLRRAYWRSYARGMPLLMKEFSEPVSRDTWLDWDSLQGIEAERRLSILCGWALEADREGQSFGLRLPGVTVPLGHSEHHLNRVLKELALYGEPA